MRGGDFEICNSLCFRGENKVLFWVCIKLGGVKEIKLISYIM